MAMTRSVLASFLAMGCCQAVQVRQSAQANMNPVRKVVTMLQAIQKKVEAEGEKEEEMYKKYMCYCKTGTAALEASVAAADEKLPQVEAAINETEAKKAQLDDDVVAHKADRKAAKASMAEATAIREKQAAEYASFKAEGTADTVAIEKAVAALEKGMGGSFLQTPSANRLQKLFQNNDDLMEDDRQQVIAFLSGGTGYAPQSGQITGILKQMLDSMQAGLAEATATEEAAIVAYEELMAAKKKEIEALTKSIEEKIVRSGELAVEIVNMKEDLDDTMKAALEDKKFLADLEKNCATKTGEWDEIVKTRAEELLALADTIKVLNDDDALDLFKKTLPSPSASFVQVKVGASSVRARALEMIHAAQKSAKTSRPQLDLIAIALHGKAGGFEKVITMIDDMVVLLKKEQVSDDEKKGYCGAEFDTTDDKKKALERSISDSEAAIADAQEAIETLTAEIKALIEGIEALDKSVAEATENRKTENSEYTELMAQDTAAKELIEFAKNRLNKFYNPKLYVAPPKRELSAEDKVVTAFGGTAAPTPAPGGIAGTGISVGLAQEAPPPPPETFGPYTKKSEESNGVISMMDMLIKDLTKEMTTAEADEKNAQADYEKMMEDSAAKRADDSKSVADDEAAKADTEAALQKHNEEKASTTQELMGTLETIKALHSECDWLLQYFDVRKEARTGEIEALGNAKAVLSGADYSLIQTLTRKFRM